MLTEQALYFIPVVLSYAPTFIFKDLTTYFNNYEIIVFYHPCIIFLYLVPKFYYILQKGSNIKIYNKYWEFTKQIKTFNDRYNSLGFDIAICLFPDT